MIEVWCWRQIGFNDDPVAFLDINGFWSPLLTSLQGLVETGFVRQEVMDDLVVAETLDDALDGFASRRGAKFSDKVRS